MPVNVSKARQASAATRHSVPVRPVRGSFVNYSPCAVFKHARLACLDVNMDCGNATREEHAPVTGARTRNRCRIARHRVINLSAHNLHWFELASRLDHFVPSSQLPMGNSPESTLSLTYRGDSVAFGFRGSVTLNCAFCPTFDLPHGVPRSQPILGAQSIALPSN